MLEKRRLGRIGPMVGSIGYGAMVHEGAYGASNEITGIAAVRQALDLGMTIIDTADFYGRGHNEEMVGRAVKGRRNEAFIATKFGAVYDDKDEGRVFPNGWNLPVRMNGTAAYAGRALERSLKRLGLDMVDLWYLHYPDPMTPIEESIGAMAKAVKAGKVRHIGLSNVSAEQVRRAHKIHPISAVQYEFSLWRREAEFDLLPTLREIGIPLIAWSPLGAGFLARPDLAVSDDAPILKLMPRYSTDNLKVNRERFAFLQPLAAELGITPAQLCLAWILNKGPDVIPIPGTRRLDRIRENALAATLVLDETIMARIEVDARPGVAVGQTII